MRLPQRIRFWLLAVAFATGQLFALAHAAGHADLGEAPHACLLCVAGHELSGAAPPSFQPAIAIVPAAPPRIAVNAAVPVSRACPTPQARGPPAA